MATPQYGFITIAWQAGGQVMTKNIEHYTSDVDAALVNFDGGGGAGTTSPDYFTVPRSCNLIDYAIATGTADTEKVRTLIDGNDVGNTMRYATHLDSLAKRPALSIPLLRGQTLRLKQVAD